MIISYLILISYLGFTVGPAKVEKVVLGAEAVTEIFEVQNFTDDSLRIKVEFEDFDVDESGKVAFYVPGHFANSLGPRATVNPEEFVIPPKDVEAVRVTSQLSPASEIPEYYGMLLFKSQPIPTRYSAAISVAGEIGVPVYYAIPEHAAKSASFDSFFVRGDSLGVVLTNTGNVHLRVTGEVIVTTYDTKIIQRDSLREFIVMPRKQRRISIPIKSVLERGSYLAKVVFDYGAIELIMGEKRFTK